MQFQPASFASLGCLGSFRSERAPPCPAQVNAAVRRPRFAVKEEGMASSRSFAARGLPFAMVAAAALAAGLPAFAAKAGC